MIGVDHPYSSPIIPAHPRSSPITHTHAHTRTHTHTHAHAPSHTHHSHPSALIPDLTRSSPLIPDHPRSSFLTPDHPCSAWTTTRRWWPPSTFRSRPSSAPKPSRASSRPLPTSFGNPVSRSAGAGSSEQQALVPRPPPALRCLVSLRRLGVPRGKCQPCAPGGSHVAPCVSHLPALHLPALPGLPRASSASAGAASPPGAYCWSAALCGVGAICLAGPDTKLGVGYVFVGHESNERSLINMLFLARHSTAHDGRRVSQCYRCAALPPPRSPCRSLPPPRRARRLR